MTSRISTLDTHRKNSLRSIVVRKTTKQLKLKI